MHFVRNTKREMDAALDILYNKIMSTSDELRLRDSDHWDPLEVMAKWVEVLDLPISKLKVIHVAGTKGKGSTAAFTESILRHHGLTTGLYTSPHLIDVRERFRVNGESISEESFLLAFHAVWNMVKEYRSIGLPAPGYFRFLTLVAFHLYIYIAPVDIIILEVGIGGRLDATNIIKSPVVCGVTLIDLDHTEVLGTTLEAIAGEKAGIVKEGVPIYITKQKDSVVDVVCKVACKQNASFYVARDISEWPNKHPIELGLAGVFQRMNAALALELSHSYLQSVKGMKSGILEGEFLSGATLEALRTVRWIGRCQVLDLDSSTGKVMYLDGAHTPASLDEVVQWFENEVSVDSHKKLEVESYSSNVPIAGHTRSKMRVLIFHCGQERKAGVLMNKLLDLAFDYVIFVPPSMFRPSKHIDPTATQLLYDVDPLLSITNEYHTGSNRVRWSWTLANVWSTLVHAMLPSDNVLVKANMDEALDWLRTKPNSLDILVTGSLYIIGDALHTMKVKV